MTPDGGRWLQHARMPTRAGGPGMARHGRAVLQRDHRVILRAMSAANLVGMLPSELEDLAVELGASRYRGRQLATWIYRKGVVDLDAMTDLPKEFRSALAERAVAVLPEVERETPSQDGSRKLVFRLDDGSRVSSVVMPDDGRVTLCLSTQVGCGYACAFCLTGTMGLARNLTAAEIIGQVLQAQMRLAVVGGQVGAPDVQQSWESRISHVVFMGMGEPRSEEHTSAPVTVPSR